MSPKGLHSIAHRFYKYKIPFFPRIINSFNNIWWGCSISYETFLPSSVVLGHRGLGVVIHEKTVIGENVTILQHVTIGGARKEGEKGAPVIGNNVLIGAGACLLGKIKIGNNVKIGANAVVLVDIPDDSTAVGVPAKIISRKDNSSHAD